MRYKKYLPTRERVRSIRALQFLGDVVFEPNLWHMNRHSVSFALFIGLFSCFLPIPFQMIVCVLLCIWIRCNVPIALVCVWISNPVTIPPIFFATYKLGTWILGQPDEVSRISLSWEWLSAQFTVVWAPLVLGSLITGLVSGSVAFVAARLYWRWRVSKEWTRRRHERLHLASFTRTARRPQAADGPPDALDTKSQEE